ncbi:MAG TPA: BlaI/MecI/CopY family transcriptional regulator [Bryobacteraceae bacterium]|nr:BlaI/MecI/CopY family transcriptional regulator [Bryobacteraceae bacterium]
MLKNQHLLSRRERQIMDVLIARGRASAAEIQSAIPDPPGYSAVRATLRIMEEKGHIRHEQQGASYVYLPRIPPERARRSALRHMLDTFFHGSPEQVMAALLDSKPSPEELDRIAAMIEAARKKGR